MPPQVLDDLTQTVNDTEGVIDSAIAFMNGFAARQQAAIDAAIANGATAAQLAPLTDLNAALQAKKNALAAAITA